MKVVFLSNYYNHHQSAFSEAMYAQTNGQYMFVETTQMSAERAALGYGTEKPVFSVMLTEHNRGDLQRKIDEADVVIIGSAPQKLIKNRIRQGKLTFEYSERIYKTGLTPIKLCSHLCKRILNYRRYKGTYMLCASAYTAADYVKLFAYRHKTYKWAYFPQVKQYDDIGQLLSGKQRSSILWVARFIDWKHPEVALMVAKRLKAEGYAITLNMIGNGVLEEEIRSRIAEYGLEDCVHLLGAMKPEQVRTHMEQSEIFLFTSDFNEGWGAVLNESMNSGCAVVASHAIGSVPFLMKDKENGLIYKNGDTEDCYQKVKYLLDNPDKRKEYGLKAYETLRDSWNAEIAAERVLELSQAILNGEKYPDLYDDGPCSKAGIIANDWLK